jgi:hypothetical protein
VRDAVSLVCVQAPGLEVAASIGVVSRLVTVDHGLQCEAVVDVGRGDADDEGQSVRVRQDVHLGTRLAPVHGARTCGFAPFFNPDVGGVEDCTGEVKQAGVVQAAQDLFVQPAPDTGS